MLLDKDLKEHKDKDKAAKSFSDQEVVGFLVLLDKDLGDRKDEDKAAGSFSDQEAEFLTQWIRTSRTAKMRTRRRGPLAVSRWWSS